jgi:hypothetical protein
MIRNLTIVAVASFVLALGCFGGAVALGGRDFMQHGWNIPMKDWHVDISDDNDHVRIRPGVDLSDADRDSTVRDIAWTGGEALQIDVPADVIFTQAAAGASASVKVTGPRRLVDQVIIENGRIGLRDADNQGGSFKINGHSIDISDDDSELSIEITAPAVRSFTLNGNGDLHLKAYDQPGLSLTVNGSGNVEAQGKTKKIDLQVSGSGQADLRSLDTGDAKIAVAGSGEVHAAPHGVAEIDLAGSGEVYLTEKPAVLTSNVAGSGEVHQDW